MTALEHLDLAVANDLVSRSDGEVFEAVQEAIARHPDQREALLAHLAALLAIWWRRRGRIAMRNRVMCQRLYGPSFRDQRNQLAAWARTLRAGRGLLDGEQLAAGWAVWREKRELVP